MNRDELTALADFDHRCSDEECVNFGQRTFSNNCKCHKTREQMMLEEIRSLRTLAAQSPEPVAVKPLEWPPRCPRGQRVHNRPALVNYTVAHYGGDIGDAIYRWAEAHSSWSDPLPTYEAAKAAAQADYEQRIRSALVSAPPQSASDGAMREAMLEACDLLAERKQGGIVSSTSKPALTAGPALPNLARQFDLMCKGCRANGLHSWEDHFFMLYEEASKGAINIDEIAETIDYDYRNGNDGRAALDQLLTAIFADIRGLAEHRVELLTACELFTKASHDARDALNSRGIACPASIALAAEKARAAIAKAEGRA